MARFFARLVASSVAPFGYGTDLWSRRDERWRNRRVNRLFAGFFATLVAYAATSLHNRRDPRLALRRDRLWALLRGYERALIHWALEPYRFAWAWQLGEGEWSRGRLTRVLAQCFMIPFAWATAGQHQGVGWRRFATRRLVGGLSMTMVACTALAFGSGPAFNDSRDESQATRLMASYGGGVSEDTPQEQASDESEEASDGSGGAGGGESSAPGGGATGPTGPTEIADTSGDSNFEFPPPGDPGNGLMTLANFTPPGPSAPETPAPETAAPEIFDPEATSPDSPTGPGSSGGVGGLGGAMGGGFGGGGGGGGAGGGTDGGSTDNNTTPPLTGDEPGPQLAGDLPVINPPPGDDFGAPPQDDHGGSPPTLATPLGDESDPEPCLINCDPPQGPPENSPPPSFVGETGAVPEPATWAMMVLGFGSLGAVLRRQRRLARLTLA